MQSNLNINHSNKREHNLDDADNVADMNAVPGAPNAQNPGG